MSGRGPSSCTDPDIDEDTVRCCWSAVPSFLILRILRRRGVNVVGEKNVPPQLGELREERVLGEVHRQLPFLSLPLLPSPRPVLAPPDPIKELLERDDGLTPALGGVLPAELDRHDPPTPNDRKDVGPATPRTRRGDGWPAFAMEMPRENEGSMAVGGEKGGEGRRPRERWDRTGGEEQAAVS